MCDREVPAPQLIVGAVQTYAGRESPAYHTPPRAFVRSQLESIARTEPLPLPLATLSATSWATVATNLERDASHPLWQATHSPITVAAISAAA